MYVNQVSEPLVKYMKSERHSYSVESNQDTRIFQDSMLMNQVSEDGIPYTLFQQIQEAGPLTLQEWADILGISARTLTRYRTENKLFQPWHSAVILQMTELMSLGIEVDR